MNHSCLSVDSLLKRLECRSKLHAGYPYNLNLNYQKLLPLWEYMLNNLGDPYVEGNYGLNTKDFEQEVINYFANLYNLPSGDAWGTYMGFFWVDNFTRMEFFTVLKIVTIP
jgi:histidine decarboxylase